MNDYIRWYSSIGMADVSVVGGKNASLGEMIQHLSSVGIRVPQGFATTAYSFHEFLRQGNIEEQLYSMLDTLVEGDLKQLARVGHDVRKLILETPLPESFSDAIVNSLAQLKKEQPHASFAVRSSATAEDLPDASFAGQQETYLNVQRTADVLLAVKKVFASLFNDRAISYRAHQGYRHQDVAICVGVQCMVRSDLAASGVMFSIDPESGHKDMIYITSSVGLGELVVQGSVNPDEFYVHKTLLNDNKQAVVTRRLGAKQQKMIFNTDNVSSEQVTIESTSIDEAQYYSLTDDDVLYLAHQACIIEKHYGQPMDIEWAKDGVDGKIYIVQARPETVRSRESNHSLERYKLQQSSKVLLEGRAVGQKIGSGHAKILTSHEQMHQIQTGDVLVADMTDPDWEPIMKKASAIITNRGGRTCHAAIIARELGIPAIVGCGNATETLMYGQEVTVSCSEGDTGFVYEGALPFQVLRTNVDEMPMLPLDMMMNLANPEAALSLSRLPNQGVGLARLEFIINRHIGIHPKALLDFDTLEPSLQHEISQMIIGYDSPVDYYVNKIAEGVGMIASAFYPKKVIVRLSDFKSNEYANLLGGQAYEPMEENPMLGYRGASRYLSDDFQTCFELECRALKYVREQMGLTNVEVMIPFVRTPNEAKGVVQLMKQFGLSRGEHGLKINMMCELPSNALLADEFLQYFDGFSIGSNDLTQLTLGLDRDSGLVSHLFDERDPSIKMLLKKVIESCRAQGKYVGICGQGPSDFPDFSQWLLEQGIDSMSLNPDSVIHTWLHLSQ